MDAKEYLKDSKRTAPDTYQNIATVKGLEAFPIDENVDLLHAAMGMVTESAEFVDVLKKTMFYKKPLDKVNLREELGDQCWYIAMALRALDTTFEEVMETNINKLKARYPDKFDTEKALNRDLDSERKILEE
jgi:NTP pyrophosphatase (non-canonical NTP hydrolase)